MIPKAKIARYRMEGNFPAFDILYMVAFKACFSVRYTIANAISCRFPPQKLQEEKLNAASWLDIVGCIERIKERKNNNIPHPLEEFI